MKEYNHLKIEPKWRKVWEKKGINKTKDNLKGEKAYILDMFPYPSGDGLHVGHPRGYIATDVYSRYKRMQGFSVLHPMGWDAFGLPAENYAIKNKVHPEIAIKKNVKRFKEQISILGFNYDWSREINTTDPAYYKWTQWIFLQMFKKGLAYESYEPINWCPSCKTGLALEDLEDGKCERCGTVVEKKPMRQWVLKITDYADRLLKDIDGFDTSKLPHFIDKKNPPKPGKVTVERRTVHAIVYNPKTNKYLGLKWHKHPWTTFIVGGVDANEDIVEAAKREVGEETGYTDIKLIKVLGAPVVAEYFAAHKNQNRVAITSAVLFELNSDKKVNTTWEEHEDFENVWLDEKDITEENMTCAELSVWLERLPTAYVESFNNAPHFDVMYYELEDGQRNDISLAEQANHEVVWVKPDEMEEFLNADSHKYVWSKMFQGKDITEKQIDLKPLLNWPESVKESQRNWIGRSEGVNFLQKVKGLDIKFQVYDSIPQTFLAQTFTVIAPEHPLVKELVKGTSYEIEVLNFVEKIMERKRKNKFNIENDLEGIFTGRYVENPFGTGDLPIWIASYVLADYGTGIVNCSAHDERDFAFAKKYKIPLKLALLPGDKELAEKVKNFELFYREPDGIIQSPDEFKGMTWTESRQPIIDYIVKKGLGERKVNFKLRDWVFSRQRYWGEPIPLIHCEKCGVVAVPEKDLPVKLPKVKFYEPTGTGESPLAAITKWVNTKCPQCGGKAKRETNTMPQWAGSSWYYLRYIDPKNTKTLVDKKKEKYWSPVDLYVGGTEHATRHLIYARFWHKFLFDLGIVSTPEPFSQLKNQGMVLGSDNRKMSKRWGNVVNPDDVVKNVGADTLRVYEMFMGPFEQEIAWSTDNMVGSRRFLEKVWKLQDKIVKNKTVENKDFEILLNKTIKKVSEDILTFNFNTAISAFMILVNMAEKVELSKGDYEIILKLLAPFAPHMTEEIWADIGNKKSIHLERWPAYDSKKIISDEIIIVVQINGKPRANFKAPVGALQNEVEKVALVLPEVKKWLDGKQIKNKMFVKGKILIINTN